MGVLMRIADKQIGVFLVGFKGGTSAVRSPCPPCGSMIPGTSARVTSVGHPRTMPGRLCSAGLFVSISGSRLLDKDRLVDHFDRENLSH